MFGDKFLKATKTIPGAKKTGTSVVNHEKITLNLDQNLDSIRQSMGNPDDLLFYRFGDGLISSIVVMYLETLTDSNLLGPQVIGPLNKAIQESKGAITENQLKLTLLTAKFEAVHDLHTAVHRLLAGFTLIVINNMNVIYAVALPGFARRGVEESPTEKVIKGPREGFNETLADNIGLIRRSIKDPNLRMEKKLIGERTKTEVAVLYLGDVANPDIVQEVRKRLEQIDIDGILESGYIAELICDRRLTLFPLVQETERPDRVISAILEGRVAILVDRSCFNIVVPVTSNEFYQTSEDFYFNWITATALRLIRAIGTIFAVTLPGLYISVISVNPELMPPSLVQLESSIRAQLPLPAVLEMVITFFAFEILREASVRFPSNLNMVLGVGGGIVMGLATINAGMVSGITVALVVFCILSTFTTSNPAKEQAWRWVRYILFVAGASFGLMGVVAAGVMVLAHMAGLKSFGVSYLAPWGPPLLVDLIDAPIRLPWWLSYRRPPTYRPKQETRFQTSEEDDLK